jgi:hypothetical protein
VTTPTADRVEYVLGFDASDPRWHWRPQFAGAGIERLMELGEVDAHAADGMRACINQFCESGSSMVTPSIVEVIARKP